MQTTRKNGTLNQPNNQSASSLVTETKMCFFHSQMIYIPNLVRCLIFKLNANHQQVILIFLPLFTYTGKTLTLDFTALTSSPCHALEGSLPTIQRVPKVRICSKSPRSSYITIGPLEPIKWALYQGKQRAQLKQCIDQ